MNNSVLYYKHLCQRGKGPLYEGTSKSMEGVAARDIFNPRRACAARVTVLGSVCVYVCLSVKSHLTYGASVRPENAENAVTYSTGNKGQKFVAIFLKLLRSRVMARNMSKKANMLIFLSRTQRATKVKNLWRFS